MNVKPGRSAIFFTGIFFLAIVSIIIYLEYFQSPSSEKVPVAVERKHPASNESLSSPHLSGDKADRHCSSDQACLPVSITPFPVEFFSIITEEFPEGVVGEDYSQALRAEGGSVPLTWKVVGGKSPPGLKISREGLVVGRATEEGEWRFTVEVRDAQKRKANKELLLVVRESVPSPDDLKPSILTTALPDGVLGRNYLKAIEIEGGEPPYGWFLLGGDLPKLVLLNKEKGVLYGIPREVGTYDFTIRVTDFAGNWDEMDYKLPIKEGEFEIITAALPSAVLGQPYSLLLQAQGGVLPYRWEFESGELPPGIEFDGERGMLRGTPGRVGSSKFFIRVKDTREEETEKEFFLNVLETAPGVGAYSDFRIVTTSVASATRGQIYLQQLEAEGGTLPYRWTVCRRQLPPQLFLDPDQGRISGVPEKEGRYIFSVLVSDQNLLTAEAEYTLTVNLQLVYITTGELTAAIIGEEYQGQIEATGGTPPYLWSIDSGSLPSGLKLDSNSGLIYGYVSDYEETKEFIFRAKAVDQTGNYDIAELRLLVEATGEPTPIPTSVFTPTPSPVPAKSPVDGLKIITRSLPAGRIGERYSVTLKASGGPLPYFWLMTGLPDGLSGSDSGDIMGIPETSGRYKIDIEVTDGSGKSVTKKLSLTIKEPYASGVSNLIAVPSDEKVGLAWVNPEDYKRVEVLRKAGSYPRDDQDGTVVYEGTGDNFVDIGLTNGVTYFYGVVAYDEDNWPSRLDETCLISASPAEVGLFSDNDPFADAVVVFSPLSPGGFGAVYMPGIVLGPPLGAGSWSGSLDVVSLHAKEFDDSPPCGGSILLEFFDNIVFNGEGDDFTVFENVFYIGGYKEYRWMEPAAVSVSQDGVTFYEFPIDYVPHYNNDGSIRFDNPYSYYKGFAGVDAVFSNNCSPDPRDPTVSGGDSFDLDDIADKNLTWVRYVKITSTGDKWLIDINGDIVQHTHDFTACSGAGPSGFDLEGVCAIHY